MNNVRVKGFKDITFWQDSGIGLIVLRSDPQGLVNWNAIGELVASLGTASIDDKVEAIAITGLNENFSTGLKVEQNNIETAREILDATNSLVSLVYSLEKPIFSILSGHSVNAGYEIALLSDVIMSHDQNKVGFDMGYNFTSGGSITSLRFRNRLDVSMAEERKNVDLVLPKETLLEDAKKFILDHKDFDYHLVRRRAMRGLRESMLEERENFIRRYTKTHGNGT